MPEIFVVQIGNLIAIPGLDANQALRLMRCRFLQQQGVEQAEERRIDADAQAKAEDDQRHESRSLAKRPHRIAKVAHEVVPGEPPSRLVEPLLGDAHIAKSAACVRPSLGLGESVGAKIFHFRLQVRADLGCEV